MPVYKWKQNKVTALWEEGAEAAGKQLIALPLPLPRNWGGRRV